MKFFKGYVETKNKKSIEKFKNRTDFKTYNQVKNLEEFAGILAEDVILLDIDEKESSDILFKIIQDLKIKCRVYETTRGKHFLFKNESVNTNKTGCSLAIGLKADIKIGTRNAYEVLKFNGIERTILYDEGAEKIPKFLTPIKKKVEFRNLKNGDGRNQLLFNYILTLQSESFSINEIKEIIKLINKYVFDEPLNDSELDIILRDEAFQKVSFFQGNTFLFDDFSRYIQANLNIIKVEGQLCIYRDNYYSQNIKDIETEMIKTISRLSASRRTEVLKYLDLICENKDRSSANYICFKNGIYDVDNEKLIEFNSNFIITNKINFDYKDDAYFEITDRTLNKICCNDEKIRLLIEEVIGYCLYSRNELGKAFFLTGEGSNGKSTFLTMIKHMIGIENISSLEVKELTERFKNSQLVGKLVNIGDDIGAEFIVDTATFRKLVTGERMTVEQKGKDPFQFNNYSKFLFSANKIPRMKDPTGATKRRMVIIPFDAKFSDKDFDYDPYIIDKLLDEKSIEYLVKIGITGLKRVLKNKKFTNSEKVIKKLYEYELSNNPIMAFWEEISLNEILNQTVSSVYQKYKNFCHENNLQEISSIEFSRQVSKEYNLESKVVKINKKSERIFIKVTDDEGHL